MCETGIWRRVTAQRLRHLGEDSFPKLESPWDALRRQRCGIQRSTAVTGELEAQAGEGRGYRLLFFGIEALGR